jgi:multiple sugar transport system substrate-binding protein
MPFSKSTEVLYYNKTFFDEHDLKVPTTWAELEDVCAKIKAIDKNSIPLGYDSEANWFITMTEQLNTPYTSATGDHFLFDTAENREFCAMFREWYLKGYVTTQEILGSYTSSLFTSKDTTKSYMSIGSSAGATHQRPTKNDDGSYPFEVGIAPIPQVDVNNPKVISQGPSVCIFDGHSDAEEEASWLFVKYLITSVEFQADFSIASGYVPVIKSVNTDPFYAQFLSKANGGEFIAALSAKVCLEQADAYYVSPAFNGSSDARDQVGILLQACLLVDAKVADPMAEIKKLFEAAVRECEYKQ